LWLNQKKLQNLVVKSKMKKIEFVKEYSDIENNTKLIEFVKEYSDIENNTKLICQENKDKTGVYLFTNTSSGNIYCGRSKNLGRRLREHLSLKYNLRVKCILISKAFVKWGYKPFKLAILEYCNEDMVRAREQFFIETIKPAYNLIKKVDLSADAKRQEFTLETRKKMSLAKQAYYAKHTSHLAKPIKVIEMSTSSEKIYKSIDQAAKELKIAKRTIRKYIGEKRYIKFWSFLGITPRLVWINSI
jgi:GIY-YIG catalytic domain/NUMOD1 domain